MDQKEFDFEFTKSMLFFFTIFLIASFIVFRFTSFSIFAVIPLLVSILGMAYFFGEFIGGYFGYKKTL
jgi:hypothetical protein